MEMSQRSIFAILYEKAILVFLILTVKELTDKRANPVLHLLYYPLLMFHFLFILL